jgi:TRAP-type uncharacterized transport system fused permease subunit
VLRVVFWVALGLAAAAFFEYGISVIRHDRGCSPDQSVFPRRPRDAQDAAIESLADGARNALPVGIACAIVGVIIGTMTLTGAASTFVRVIVSIGEGSICPLARADGAHEPAARHGHPDHPELHHHLVDRRARAAALGVPLIVSHMFVFYFGIMADLTPPVALAAFAAAPIAKETGLKISLMAVRIGAAGFVVPFMALAMPITDEIGWGAAIAFFAWHVWRTRESTRRTVPKPAE